MEQEQSMAQEGQEIATPENEAPPAEDNKGASPETEEQKEETVPYSRFKEVYGTMKHLERELDKVKSSGATVTQPAKSEGKPREDDFENYSDYVEALADWKVEQREQNRLKDQTKVEEEDRQRKWDEKISAGLAKDPNFATKGYIPQGLVPILSDSDHVVEFAYYFGDRPEEARRLLNMSPVAAAREIGRLEASFKMPKPKTQTSAPGPTVPLKGSGASTTHKKPEDMTMAEYKEWRAGGGK